ncbi:TRAPP subunit BET5 [Cyberlindnera jadinii NRRL Y-1542]|uniref:Trafficking protein particle complex subunit n=1 Tax=Cyberlindnera jadinii (strain ATCC 18201 / CBS 1600 / BCRC 20928 / JCM 3617 / NBRC 0987 / NRRL Y-1542) TaxID=983966 RepID=A0A1E4S9E8_CYBJN|nr:snare-like protein [Cyberlindnera jadinii NRRL Y-1542]ODV76098.1 snare-like protein [Cyberlindnera jadinii NRRL Y-1542]
MTIFSFWIFDRHCNCIYSREWTQVLNPATESSGTINAKANEDNAKLLFGVLFSLRNIARKVGDTPEQENTLNSFATAKYRAHFYESPSGLRLCILSDLETQNLQTQLRDVYSNIYVEHIVKNPLSPVDFKPGSKITNQRFIRLVDRYLGPQ